MTEIREPATVKEWEAYYDLRYRIMRAPLGQPRGSERNDGDADGIHFALYEDGKLLAIARLDNSDTAVAQVRFVAVEESCQGRGLGKKIMLATENASREKGVEKVVLHARDYAVDFYLNLGYTLIGPSYKLFGVLQHFLMEKAL